MTAIYWLGRLLLFLIGWSFIAVLLGALLFPVGPILSVLWTIAALNYFVQDPSLSGFQEYFARDN